MLFFQRQSSFLERVQLIHSKTTLNQQDDLQGFKERAYRADLEPSKHRDLRSECYR